MSLESTISYSESTVGVLLILPSRSNVTGHGAELTCTPPLELTAVVGNTTVSYTVTSNSLVSITLACVTSVMTKGLRGVLCGKEIEVIVFASTFLTFTRTLTDGPSERNRPFGDTAVPPMVTDSIVGSRTRATLYVPNAAGAGSWPATPNASFKVAELSGTLMTGGEVVNGVAVLVV
ncbi:MAG: hypothetical protein IT428_24410 [Planctomycetaceae bacterium]|nr:hypothetical protein [Planctomycetaceae bacterium]